MADPTLAAIGQEHVTGWPRPAVSTTKGEDMTLNADSIRIDTDEGQFLLVIDTEEFGTLRVNFHSCALEFEDEVRKQLRPYALEAVHARATMPEPYQDEAYAEDDPKHPLWLERIHARVDMGQVEELERIARDER